MVPFITAIAAGALPLCSVLLGAWFVGLSEVPKDSPEQKPTRIDAGTPARLLVVIVGASLMLVGEPVIAPLLLQYLLLIAAPLLLGAAGRVGLGRYLAARG
ncbi:hypothetical protein [Microbacterium stercoris]|uniref:Uncharacterized protein n=1 Tax=Microbacterium stercoris TaxID=2820289 RepID=A0A939TN61_9MICO|nr:hypothetical protein [Microbacterium stercoris]MBO3663898.1 hypothetical protein [Microbacterium stercoris]